MPPKKKAPARKRRSRGTPKKVIRITCDPDMQQDRVPLADLEDFQGDLKALSDDSYAEFRANLLDLGYSFPTCLWHGHRSILDGHQRNHVLGRMIAEEGYVLVDVDGSLATGVPVSWIMAENEQQARKKILAAVSQYGKISPEGLNEFLKLADMSWPDVEPWTDLPDFDTAAFEKAFVDEPKPDPPEPQEAPENPVSRLGDLWSMGKHRLLCGDSTEEAAVAHVMDGKQAQLVFTDPPYGVGYDGGAKKRKKSAGDEVGTGIYGAALPHLKWAADDEAALYLWYADGHAAAAAAAGYQIVAQIIWAKNHAQFVTSAHYKGKHEPCYYAHRKGKSARWHGSNAEVTLWEYDRSPRNDFHPTQKPVELAARAIRNSSAPGQRILDLFLGGGTTLIAASQEGRTCYALDIDPAYIDVSVLRWQEYTGEAAVLDGDGRTFAEVSKERLAPTRKKGVRK